MTKKAHKDPIDPIKIVYEQYKYKYYVYNSIEMQCRKPGQQTN